MPSGDSYEPFINFDPRFCRRIARVAAAACAVLVLCTVIILVTVDPSNTRCPGWLIIAKNGTANSIWGFVAMQAVPAICMSFIAFNWQWFARRVINKLTRAEQTLRADDPKGGLFGIGGKYEALSVLLYANSSVVVLSLVCVAFCSIPLLVIAGRCV
jgi:hypothetical protein